MDKVVKKFVEDMESKIEKYRECHEAMQSTTEIVPDTQTSNSSDVTSEPNKKDNTPDKEKLDPIYGCIAAGVAFVILIVVIIKSVMDKKFWVKRESYGKRTITLQNDSCNILLNDVDPEKQSEDDSKDINNLQVVHLGTYQKNKKTDEVSENENSGDDQ